MGHLTDREVAGFLDADLAGPERERVEAHLDACDECRSELLQVARLAQEVSTPGDPRAGVPANSARRPASRWRWPVGIGGLAVAAALATLLLWPAGAGWDERPVPERWGNEGVRRLDTHAPEPGGVIARDALRFSWASLGTESYRITVTGEDGALVWSRMVTDTVVAPPADLELPPGRTFFWYVDAIEIGIVARTGAHSFTVAP
jgi:hypothetical protein